MGFNKKLCAKIVLLLSAVSLAKSDFTSAPAYRTDESKTETVNLEIEPATADPTTSSDEHPPSDIFPSDETKYNITTNSTLIEKLLKLNEDNGEVDDLIHGGDFSSALEASPDIDGDSNDTADTDFDGKGVYDGVAYVDEEEPDIKYEEPEPSDVKAEKPLDIKNEEPLDIINEEPSDVEGEERSDIKDEVPSYYKYEEPSDIKYEESSDVKDEVPSYFKDEEAYNIKDEEPSYFKDEEPSEVRNEEPSSEVKYGQPPEIKYEEPSENKDYADIEKTETEWIENGKDTEDVRVEDVPIEIISETVDGSEVHMSMKGDFMAVFVGFFIIIGVLAILGIMTWRRILRERYGREMLIDEDEFYDPRDMKHFSLYDIK